MAPQPTTLLPASPAASRDDENSSVGRTAPPGYAIILRIRHRALDPAAISAELGWEPNRAWKAGDQAITPMGKKLHGLRTDGLWSRTFPGQRNETIVQNLDAILDHLLRHKPLLLSLEKTGAQVAVYLQLSGDANIGDRISWQVLRKLAELRIALEFEVFPNWEISSKR